MTFAIQTAEDNAFRFEPLTAISYSRVSTERQVGGGASEEGFSLAAQRAANKRHALSLGAVVAAEFVERGASARTTDRPELRRLLEYVTSHKVDFVIVHKLDRLARNRADDVQIVRALEEAGVRLVSTTENIDETASGRLVHGIMASIAEFYSQNLSTEVKKGLRQKVEEGGTSGRAPLGYLNVRRASEGRRTSTGQVDLDPERAAHVAWMFETYAAGTWSVSRIVDELISRGLTARPLREEPGKPLGPSAVHRMLKNPYYKGVVTLNGVEHPGSHPAIVSAELWQRVQEMLASRRCGERSRVHTHFLKSTLYCYSCERRLIMQHVTSRAGKRYAYFVCSGRQTRSMNCRQPAIPVAQAEQRVEHLYAHLSITPHERERLERRDAERQQAARADLTAQVREIEQHLDELGERQLKLLDAYYAGAIPRTLFLDQQREFTKRRTHAEIVRDRITASNKDTHRELARRLDIIEDCDRRYADSDVVQKRRLNRMLFQKIRIGRDPGQTRGILVEEFSHLLDQRALTQTCDVRTSGKPLVRPTSGFAVTDTMRARRDSNP